MFKRLFSAALVFGAAALAPPVATAACAPRDFVIDNLKTRYAEELAAGGLQETRPVQTMIEIWASAASGTFTILVTNPNGVSCVVASGKHFFLATPKAGRANVESPAAMRQNKPTRQ